MKELIAITKIRNNPQNPRIIKDDKFKKLVESIKSFPEMLEKRPIVVNEHMMVLGGNMRLRACKEAGLKKVWVDIAQGWTEQQQKEFTIKDNASFGEWDWDVLANEWDSTELEAWGADIPTEWTEETPDDFESHYSKSINTPIYEITGEKPKTETLVDTTKTDQLQKQIDETELPESDKTFLKLAAQRHLTFDYSKIAEYYAHADKPTQELMENSGLVIIDLQKAIENGFVQLSEQLLKIQEEARAN